MVVCRGPPLDRDISGTTSTQPIVLIRRLGCGGGANLTDRFESGIWSAEEALLSINARELLAVEKGLLAFEEYLIGKVVAVYCDNTTAVSYLRRQGGTHSSLLNSLAQRILRWAEVRGLSLMPQFVMGAHNVVADSLSRPNQIVGSEWTLNHEVFKEIARRRSVNIDLFATSLNHQCSAYFAPVSDSMAAHTLYSSHGIIFGGMHSHHLPW